MFEVGFTEILLIFGIALLVLGPARLPKLAADVGRWAGRARAMARQLRTQLEQETQFDPLAETKPAAPAHTIHTPAATPAPNPVPEAAVAPPPDVAGDESRAAPAQFAAAAPPAATGLREAAGELHDHPGHASDPHSAPAGTSADEPKPG